MQTLAEKHDIAHDHTRRKAGTIVDQLNWSEPRDKDPGCTHHDYAGNEQQ
jgi:hypothetical protein